MKKITLLAACFAAFAMSAQETVWEDSFEDYGDFAFEAIGDYSQIDNDGDATYGDADVDFTNEGYTGTAIVFNPSMADPADPAGYETRTGAKSLNMFASTGDVSGSALNDDYIITPLINLSGATGSNFSFWAKSITADFGLERIEVLLSTTGTSEADFTEDLSGGEVMVPVDYTEYSYDISAYDGMQVYIAIHYVAQDSFVLLMDDFLVTAATLGVDSQAFSTLNYYVDANNRLNISNGVAMDNVSLYNVLGQEVVNRAATSTNEVVDMSSLTAGVYIARVMIGGSNQTFKVVKK